MGRRQGRKSINGLVGAGRVQRKQQLVDPARRVAAGAVAIPSVPTSVSVPIPMGDGPPWWFTLGGWLGIVPADFVMARDMLNGAKRRSEARVRQRCIVSSATCEWILSRDEGSR
jgi:hypothetical protein